MPEDEGRSLFLLICSNHKKEGGIARYDKAASIRDLLPPASAHSLFQARDTIRKLITTDASVERDGEKLRDHDYNRGLVKGPDFQQYGLNHGGKYLSAAERYDGTFYQPLGDEKVSLLTGTPHHVLIISGLYGLLTPTEPVQLYTR